MIRIFLPFIFTAYCFGLPLIELPTENTAILETRPKDFYMYVNRHFEGKDSKPWEAGQYGFVRNMKRTESGVIGTRFHEGADISPVDRNSSGTPLDPIKVIANGKVVYIQPSASGSNYGRYVVVEHNWGEGPILSLYAHLAKITCEINQDLTTGEQIGILGYSGAGINKTRAHLHFEIALQLSDNFEAWHTKFYKNKSGHGNYNGLNLTGLNAIDLIKMQRENKVNSIAEFLKTQPSYYSITFPFSSLKSLQQRYPWLWLSPQDNAPNAEVSFSASGLPLSIRPSNRKITTPTITGLKPFLGRHEDRTIKRLSGSGRTAKITESGKRYLALLTGEF